MRLGSVLTELQASVPFREPGDSCVLDAGRTRPWIWKCSIRAAVRPTGAAGLVLRTWDGSLVVEV